MNSATAVFPSMYCSPDDNADRVYHEFDQVNIAPKASQGVENSDVVRPRKDVAGKWRRTRATASHGGDQTRSPAEQRCDLPRASTMIPQSLETGGPRDCGEDPHR